MKKFLIPLLLTLFMAATVQAQLTTVANMPSQQPIGTALKGTNLYVSAWGGNKIVKIDLTQPFPVTPTTVLSNIIRPTGLMVIGDYLYFNVDYGTEIPGLPVEARSARFNLTNPTPVLEQLQTNNTADAQGFARIGDTLYIASADNGIYRLNLSQPLPQAGVLITSEKCSGLAIRGSELYFGKYDGNTVFKINRHQSNPTPVPVVTGLAGPEGLTFSGNFLFASESSGSRIVKFDVTQANPTVETVVSGLAGPTLTVFDGLSIYFGQQNSGVVSRLSINSLSFSPPAAACVTESAALRTGGSPLGGVYSGPFVTNSGNGETFSFNAQAAGPGTYNVTYTFGVLTSTASITVTGLPTVSATSTNITCNGLNNGSATATGSSGTTYLWSNGGTTTAISGLAPGTYTVTVTNAGGCTATASRTITEPQALVFITATTPNVGTMNNGTATASNITGGTAPYSYLWTTGATTVGITGLAAGLYNVTVTDANGCTHIETATVEQQAVIAGDACSTANNINSLFGTAVGVPVVSTPYDNTGTDATGDPAINLANCFFQSDPLQHTIWYTFTGNGNRYLIRTVPGAATNYIQNGDTQASLFSGACNSPVFVSCNDDEDANNNVFNISFEVNTVAGQEYRLLLDGYGGAQGQFCLEVTRIGNVNATDISKTDIRLAPNPTTGFVQLSNVTAEEIQVFDSMGRLVQHLTQPGNTLDLSGQPAGLYIVQIRESNKLYSAKVVKE